VFIVHGPEATRAGPMVPLIDADPLLGTGEPVM
jgi:hypothetical protein